MSPSSSLVSPQWRYDVFPSFRGPDVRRTFLSHLFGEFERKGIKTFKDNSMKRGKSISPELKQAIRESRICIIILSKNYASSSWTLKELDEIVYCSKTYGKTVLTIFYEVDPTHVRKQSGYFGKAYRKTCEKKTEQERQRWSQALTCVADILGEHSLKWDSEADMIKKIATDVSNELSITASRDFDGLVGIEAHITEMDSLLCLQSDETRMVGIWGPLGIGKTTIARAMYNRISRNFQRSVFMKNVKKSYTSGGDVDSYTLKLRLQRKFLSKILDHKDMEISHLGTAEQRLKFKKVLVVLDNVDKLEQLQALANGAHWFGKGSRIIVTTDNKHLLEAHKIQHIYEVRFPSKDEALEIFSRSAFAQNAPPEGYMKLAVQVTEIASYLPLGLCVLGKALCGKSASQWTDELPRIKTSLNGDIEQVLIVGYNGLDDKDKDIFLHIACLFEGKGVDCVMQFLANSGLDVKYGLGVLVQRALISILRDKSIIMHRLLRQMGREIVRKHSIHLSRRCRFLMGACNIYDVVVAADNIGTGTVLGTFFLMGARNIYDVVVADNIGTGTVLSIFLGTSKVNLASEKAPSEMHDHQFPRLYRDSMEKGRKLEKLWNGTKLLVFRRIPLYLLSMFWLLKHVVFSIMSMFPPAFANIRFGISKRVFT